jgi:DNA-binding Lrp family transcriptional regulator
MSNPLFTQEEIAVIRALQVDLPLVPEPYKQIADQLGMSEARLLEIMESLRERGCLKRMSIALRHNNVGYTINVMMVWDVPDERLEEVGNLVAQNPQVTHCYTRNKTPEFDYNFYSMVHAMTEADYDKLVANLQAIIQPTKFSALRTTAELKKIGMKYFVEDPYGGLG